MTTIMQEQVNEDVKESWYEQYCYSGNLVQCAVEDCIYVAQVEKIGNSMEGVCPFHGKTTFVDEVTSPFRLSKRGVIFAPIRGGHIALYITEWDRQFAGVLYSSFGQHAIITSRYEAMVNVPERYKEIIRSIWKLVPFTEAEVKAQEALLAASRAGAAASAAKAQAKKQQTPKPETFISADTVVCAECGFSAPSISKHLQEVHGMSPAQYREKHSDARIVSDQIIAQFKAKKK